jgi:hypothetical protein
VAKIENRLKKLMRLHARRHPEEAGWLLDDESDSAKLPDEYEEDD